MGRANDIWGERGALRDKELEGEAVGEFEVRGPGGNRPTGPIRIGNWMRILRDRGGRRVRMVGGHIHGRFCFTIIG